MQLDQQQGSADELDIFFYEMSAAAGKRQEGKKNDHELGKTMPGPFGGIETLISEFI